MQTVILGATYDTRLPVLAGHAEHVGGVVPVHPPLMYVFGPQIQSVQIPEFEPLQLTLD